MGVFNKHPASEQKNCIFKNYVIVNVNFDDTTTTHHYRPVGIKFW